MSRGSSTSVLVLDIESSGVHGAIAKRMEGGILDIQQTVRSHPFVLPEVNVEKLWKELRDLAADVIHELQAGTHKSRLPFAEHPEAIVIFSSPWYFSEVRQFRNVSDIPIPVTEAMLAGFFSEEEEQFRSAALERFRVAPNEIAALPVERMQVLLNGYPVGSVSGKRARTIESFLYFSAVFGRASEDIRALLAEQGIRRVHLQTSPYVFYRAAQELEIADAGRVIINVGGEVTEVTLIKDGVLWDSVSYARGLNFVARRLAEALTLDADAAIRYLQEYGAGALEQEKASRTEKIVADAVVEWKKMLGEALEHVASKGLLPDVALVAGPGSILAEFARAASDEAFGRLTIFGRALTAEALALERFTHRFVHVPSAFSNAELANLLVGCFYGSF